MYMCRTQVSVLTCGLVLDVCRVRGITRAACDLVKLQCPTACVSLRHVHVLRLFLWSCTSLLAVFDYTLAIHRSRIFSGAIQHVLRGSALTGLHRHSRSFRFRVQTWPTARASATTTTASTVAAAGRRPVGTASTTLFEVKQGTYLASQHL
jgi:hypothetical protein